MCTMCSYSKTAKNEEEDEIMTFSHLNQLHTSKKAYSSKCAAYRHKKCKGFRGFYKEKCECGCHE